MKEPGEMPNGRVRGFAIALDRVRRGSALGAAAAAGDSPGPGRSGAAPPARAGAGARAAADVDLESLLSTVASPVPSHNYLQG